MADNESTMKWKVDIGQLTKAMQEAKRSIRIANAEFKTATAGMDRWSKSTTGLEAKLKQLNSTLPQQKKILSDLEKQYKITADNMGENSKEAVDLKLKIEEQRATIVKTETSINKYTDQLGQMQKEQAESATAYGKLNKTIEEQQSELDSLKNAYKNAVVQYGANSKEAKLLASEIKNLSGELADNKAKMSDAEKSADNLDKSLDDVGDSADDAAKGGFTVLKGALANLVADGFRKAIDGAKEFAKSMIGEAASVKAQASQFEQTFGDMGDEAEAAINRVAKSSGILDTRLKTVGAQIYAFAKANGATVPEAMELMETSLTAAADSAAYYDKSLDDSAETLMSFLKGNYANDAALGVSATEFTRNAKATELFGKKYNDLTEIQKQQTLLKMVTDSQKASGAMGQAAREADGWENVQGNLNEAWKQFKASVGTPFLEALIPVIQDVTSSFQEWKENVDWEAFNATVKEIADNIKNAFQWIIDNGATIVAVITGIATATAVYLGYTTALKVMTEGWMALSVVQKIVAAGQAVLNAVMAANPIGLVIAAIAGLVVAFMILWNKSEAFRNFWIGLWENIKEAVSAAKEKISGWIENIKSKIQEFSDKATAIKNNIAKTWNNIKAKTQELKNKVVEFFGNIKTGISNKIASARDAVSNAVDKIKEFLSFSGLKKKVAELFNSIKEKITSPINKAKELVTKAVNKIKDIFPIKLGKIFSGIKLPHFDISGGKAPWGIGGKGTKPSIDIDWYAKGGVFDKGARLVGMSENGAEAIVPLENNTKWIAKVARELVKQIHLVSSSVNANVNSMNGTASADGYVKTQNLTFNQYNTSPKELSRLDIYRQTNNLLFSAKVGLSNV